MHIQRCSHNISTLPFSHIRTKSSDNNHSHPHINVNTSNAQHLKSQQHFIYSIVPSHQRLSKGYRLKRPRQLHYEGDLHCFDKVKPFQTNIRTIPKNVNKHQLHLLKGNALYTNNMGSQLNKEQQRKRNVPRKSPVPLTRNYLLHNHKQVGLLNENNNNHNGMYHQNPDGHKSNVNKELSAVLVRNRINKSPGPKFPSLFHKYDTCSYGRAMFLKKPNRINNANSSFNNNNNNDNTEDNLLSNSCAPDFSENNNNNTLKFYSHDLKTIKLKSNDTAVQGDANSHILKNDNKKRVIINGDPLIIDNNNSFTKTNSNISPSTSYINNIKPERSHSQSAPDIFKEIPTPLTNPATGVSKKIRNIYQFTHVGFDGESEKPHNQDIAFIEQNFAGNKGYLYMSVCDGHGLEGHRVSGYIKRNLPKKLTKLLKGKDLERPSPNEKAEINKLIVKAFKTSNNDLIRNAGINSVFSGSTCVSVIFTPSKLISANIGDSRAVIGRVDECTSKWSSFDLTRDHKPTDKDEARRILNASGRIQALIDEETGEFVGPQRVWLKEDDVPGLAMTRSFGDRVAATIGVVSEPEILEYALSDTDKFVIIASDGVWEFMSSSEVVDIIKEFYIKNDLKGCCEHLYLESKKRWLREEEVIDDITMVLVFYDK